MGFDQKGSTVFSVKKNKQGQWDVCEEGFENPLASFNSPEDANKYARNLANVKEGSTVKVIN